MQTICIRIYVLLCVIIVYRRGCHWFAFRFLFFGLIHSVQFAHQAAPKKMPLRKAQKFQLFRPIGTQCVMGVQSVRAKARRKLKCMSLRLAFLHKDRA